MNQLCSDFRCQFVRIVFKLNTRRDEIETIGRPGRLDSKQARLPWGLLSKHGRLELGYFLLPGIEKLASRRLKQLASTAATVQDLAFNVSIERGPATLLPEIRRMNYSPQGKLAVWGVGSEFSEQIFRIFKNNCFAEMSSGSEELRLIDVFIAQR